MEIIVASQNKGKIKEFKAILEPLGYTVLSLDTIHISMEEFEETGSTFEENARLKAQYIFECTGKATIADDSGLILDAHPEILGVYSARYLGEDTPYATKNASLLSLYEGETNRACKFVSAIAYVTEKEQATFIGEINGTLAFTLTGENGFGYDPLFIPNGYDESFAQMDSTLKNRISHRALALLKFAQYIKEPINEK